MKKILCKYSLLFVFGAFTYMIIEMLFRGHTHWSMGIVGGIVLILVGLIDEFTPEMPLVIQGPLSSLIITILEYFAGIIVNIKLGWDVWDYSNLPFNLHGQICLYFSLLWIPLGIFAVYLDNFIRQKIFGEEPRQLRWWF